MMKVLRIGYKLLLVCVLTACGSDDAVRSDQTAENTDEPASDRSLADVLSPEMFSAMFLHQAETACDASAFTYESLIRAAGRFSAFGTTGSAEARRREVAAFLANVSHETTGGWAEAPDGPFAWGLCFREELACGGTPSFCAETYCQSTSTDFPCKRGESYHGRGPLQLSWNYNYGAAGEALGQSLSGGGRWTNRLAGGAVVLDDHPAAKTVLPRCDDRSVGTSSRRGQRRTLSGVWFDR